MRITIEAKDFQPEYEMDIAKFLYHIAGKFENSDSEEDERVVDCTWNCHVLYDDWDVYTKIELEV
jgi:hypothetical protein